MTARLWAVTLLFVSMAPGAWARTTLFVEEPYSYDGAFAGTGHAAVYLTNVCADSPVVLRRCHPGELGVVISRYDKIAGYDWMAIPLIPYLYAVDKPEDVPLFADPETVDFLRDQYRRKHLEQFAPDGEQDEAPGGHWVELVGVAYRRTIYAFQVETSEQQDDDFIRAFNSRPNRGKFNLVTHNCADFARNVVDFYFPKAVHRSILGDLGVTTPKQLGRTLVHFSARHPELDLTTFVIPQVPGSIRRSRPIHGVVESAFGAKKYLLPIFLVHPIVATSLAVGTYVDSGNFSPARNAMIFDPAHGLQPPLDPAQRRTYRRNLEALKLNLDQDQDGNKALWRQLQQNAESQLDDSGKPVLRAQLGRESLTLGLARETILDSSVPPGVERRLVLERLDQELQKGGAPRASDADISQDLQLLQQIGQLSPKKLTQREPLSANETARESSAGHH
jgi:hypothetical protein